METGARVFYLTLMLIGIGLFSGFTFPCLNGPFNVLKLLRKIGKPFTCPICSFFWSVIIASAGIYHVPIMGYMILGSAGWGMFLMHVSGYQVIYQGMEDE